MTDLRNAFCFSLLLLATAPLALAQGTYTQIDFPGAVATAVQGIDAVGDLSGFYTDSNNIQHGFLLSAGLYTTIDYPGATATALFGINSSGSQIAGWSDSQAFVYDTQTRTFADIAYPGANYTTPLAINDSGSVVGTFQGKSGGIVFGFEMVGPNYQRISLPGSDSVSASGIADSNEAVGYAHIYGTGSVTDFLVKPGEKPHTKLPSFFNGLPEVLGINPSGSVLVGAYYPAGFAEGFTYQDGNIQTIVFNGGTTFAYSINEAGEVAGVFVDQSNSTHGFTWTPPAPVDKK